MWLALALSCRDPILQEMDAVPLPALASADPIRDLPVVAVSGAAVFLDPTPWRDLLPDAVPARIVALDAEQAHAFALPALVEAIEPLREAAAAADRPPVIAVSAGADVPYRAVVRVLYSLGMAQISEVELRVATPAGAGALPYWFPGYCAPSSSAPPRPPPAPVVDPPSGPRAEVDVERLVALLGGGSSGPCVVPTVVEVPAGLVVALDELEGGHGGCVVALARLEGAAPAPPAPLQAADWRGAIVVPAAGACPSVPSRDPAALRALLGRTAALGEPCPSATLTALDATPWGEVVGLLAVMRERHDGAALGVTVDAQGVDCAPSWVLSPE